MKMSSSPSQRKRRKKTAEKEDVMTMMMITMIRRKKKKNMSVTPSPKPRKTVTTKLSESVNARRSVWSERESESVTVATVATEVVAEDVVTMMMMRMT